MENLSTSGLTTSQSIETHSQTVPKNEPTKYDEMITDILKHLTTLNTGLLAIIAALNAEIRPVFQMNSDYTKCFIITFYISLTFCILGFITTVFVLRRKVGRNPSYLYRVRDLMVITAAVGYVIALMFLLALFSSGYQAL